MVLFNLHCQTGPEFYWASMNWWEFGWASKSATPGLSSARILYFDIVFVGLDVPVCVLLDFSNSALVLVLFV